MEKKILDDIAFYQKEHNNSTNANLRYYLTEVITQLSALLNEVEMNNLNKTDHGNPDKRYNY